MREFCVIHVPHSHESFCIRSPNRLGNSALDGALEPVNRNENHRVGRLCAPVRFCSRPPTYPVGSTRSAWNDVAMVCESSDNFSAAISSRGRMRQPVQANHSVARGRSTDSRCRPPIGGVPADHFSRPSRRPLCDQAAQLSSDRPSTRSNSRRLFVTSVACSASAWQAIHRSLAPIGVPEAFRAVDWTA